MDRDEILGETQKAKNESRTAVEINPTAKAICDALQPLLVQMFAGVFKSIEKERKMDFLNSDWAQNLAKEMIRQQLAGLFPETKEAIEKAFEKTQVDVVRHPDRIVIAIDAREDKDVEEVRAIMLDALLVPISQTVALFGCKANVEQSS